MAQKLTGTKKSKATSSKGKPRKERLDTQAEASREGKSTVAGTTAGHNVKARKGIIKKAQAAIRAIDAKADPLREQVRGFNKEIGDVFRGLKTDLGMKRKDAEFAFRLLDLEDDEERGNTLDTIREIFEAAGEGETVDWIAAANKADAEKLEPMTKAERTAAEKEAKTAGREAGAAGKVLRTANPHPLNSPAFNAWDEGYLEGMAANVPGAGQPNMAGLN